MKTYRTMLGVACAAVIVLLAAGLALAQSGAGAGAQLLSPLVVDVAQDVPVAVVLAVPLPDGEVVTVTAPITVSLALQVRLSGADVVTATSAADASPVAVAAAPPAPVADGARPELGGVAWAVSAVERPGQTLTHSVDDYTTRGQFFVVRLELENVGLEPLDLGQMLYDGALNLALRDKAGRTFAPFQLKRSTGEECNQTEVNPGLPVECYTIFEVPAQTGPLSVVVADADGEEIALPLP